MILSYPDFLPCFSVHDYGYKQRNTIQRSEFGSGFVRNRRKFKVAPLLFQVRLHLTEEQLGGFQGWRHEILEDVNWFSARLRTGTGKQEHVVRFISNDEQPVWLPSVELWELSLVLESRRQRYKTEEQVVIGSMGVPHDFGTRVQNILERYYE